MKFASAALTIALCTVGLIAHAVGVANRGSYRTYAGERAPADMAENVRIEPPPTGGVLETSVRTDLARYHVGDHMKIFMTVNRDSYVYVFDTDAVGISRLIFPNYYDTQNFLKAGKTYYFPDRGYDMEVTGPAGRENLTIVAVSEEYPFLADYRRYTRQDPYPTYRDGAAELVRRIERFRKEPWGAEVHAVRPAPKENLWGTDSTTFYTMGAEGAVPATYKVARYGQLEIDSYPNNARLYIDGDYFGRSPQVVERLEIGYHKIMLQKEGYLPYECNVYIEGNKSKHMDLFLKQTPVEPGFSRSQNPAQTSGWGYSLPVKK